MGMKISVILVEKSLTTLMVMLVLLQSSHFLHNFHINALALGEVVLGGNGKLYKKTFLWSKFHYHGNDMKLLMKFYTINHSIITI